MTTNTRSTFGQLSDLSDQDLLAHLHLAAQAERRATAHLVALLIELDSRRLYLGEGFPSLFAYCTDALTQLERSKTGATDRPRRTGPGTSSRAEAASRHVP